MRIALGIVSLIVFSVVMISFLTTSTSPYSSSEKVEENTNRSNNEKKWFFTLEEVAKHNKPDDCWMVIHGKVYDVTSYIYLHPGGDIILQGCGKDATELFETKGGLGGPHSKRARQLLEKYYIGELKKE